MDLNESDLKDLAIRLSEIPSRFDCQLVPGDVSVLQVVVDDFDEFPIYVSITDTQLLFITYLWTEADVDPARRTELLESMLDMNIPIPLSSFSRIGDRYVLFGAVRRDCTLDAVVTELATLAENAVDALEAMQDYFK